MQNPKLRFKIQNFLHIFFLLFFILSFCSNSYAAKGIAQRIEEKVGLDEDATLQERVDAIGQKLAVVCDRKDIIFTFKVLKGEEINAFALVDGYI